jgi:hypothetical protein
VYIVLCIRVENEGFGAIRLWANKEWGIFKTLVTDQAGATRWLDIAVITGGEIARRTWIRDRWGDITL